MASASAELIINRSKFAYRQLRILQMISFIFVFALFFFTMKSAWQTPDWFLKDYFFVMFILLGIFIFSFNQINKKASIVLKEATDYVEITESSPYTVEGKPVVQYYRIIKSIADQVGLKTFTFLIDPTGPSDELNAFTTGPKGTSGVVIVASDDLLKKVSERAVAGVVAHEIGHVMNNDTAFLGIIKPFNQIVTYIILPIALIGTLLTIPFDQASDFKALGNLFLTSVFIGVIVMPLLISWYQRVTEHLADFYTAGLGLNDELLEGLYYLAKNSKYTPADGLVAILLSLYSSHPPIIFRIRRLLRLQDADEGFIPDELEFIAHSLFRYIVVPFFLIILMVAKTENPFWVYLVMISITFVINLFIDGFGNLNIKKSIPNTLEELDQNVYIIVMILAVLILGAYSLFVTGLIGSGLLFGLSNLAVYGSMVVWLVVVVTSLFQLQYSWADTWHDLGVYWLIIYFVWIIFAMF